LRAFLFALDNYERLHEPGEQSALGTLQDGPAPFDSPVSARVDLAPQAGNE